MQYKTEAGWFIVDDDSVRPEEEHKLYEVGLGKWSNDLGKWVDTNSYLLVYKRMDAPPPPNNR